MNLEDKSTSSFGLIKRWRIAIAEFILDLLLKCFSTAEDAPLYRCNTPLGPIFIVRKKGWPAIKKAEMIPTVHDSTHLIVLLDGYPPYDEDPLAEKIKHELPMKSSSSGYTEEECPELKTTLVKHARVALPPQSTQIIIADEDEVVLEDLPRVVLPKDERKANFELGRDNMSQKH